MLVNIIILIICAMGTITSSTNATRANSVGGMLLWIIAGAIELISTILSVMRIFA